MRLTEHFTFEELTNSTARPDLVAANREEAGRLYLANLTDLAKFILEPIRAKYGPLIVDNGFRGEVLNKAVGGASTSLHRIGKAADVSRKDWTWERLGEVMLWLKNESGLRWGEAIREKRTKTGGIWLHITTPAPGNVMEMWGGIDGKYTAFGK